MKKQTEEHLQSQIVQWFNNTYCLKSHEPRLMVFSVPNGGTRNVLEATRMKASGVLSGVSDLIVVLPRKVLFVELKLATGRQSKSQIEFESRVTKLGHPYFVIRSLEEFKELIRCQKI